jgi:co-chaperonin GroES (HSP10)|tara:strand:+ start:1032 stop:1292 length:261 start_codon:yes stop_codon:yes gene_type:complete
MKAIGRNLIVNMTKVGVSETKGGLLLAEKQREDIRYAEGKVLSVGEDVVGIKEKDLIYFDKNNSHQILIKQELYNIVRMDSVVVVL